jgi:heme/copper-type cytochrome/quinol oxidase subunit 2
MLLGPALAQNTARREDDLLSAVKACQALPPDPFKSVAEIRKEINCVAAATKARGNSSLAIASPAIRITARNGLWEYRYSLDGAFQDNRACSVTGSIVLPEGRAVNVSLTSEDTIHEWLIPALGVRADAMPGRIQVVTLQNDAAISIQSTEVRNAGSPNMRSTAFEVRFLSQPAYAQWERETLRTKGCGHR